MESYSLSEELSSIFSAYKEEMYVKMYESKKDDVWTLEDMNNGYEVVNKFSAEEEAGETEAFKREHDEIERRKNLISEEKRNEILFEKHRENKLDFEKLESIAYCWNNPSWSRVTNKTTNEYKKFSYCCPEFPLHSIFTRKDFTERTLTSIPLMPVPSSEYCRQLDEEHSRMALRYAKALDSDGDSPRSASPLSSEVDEEDFLMSRKHERLSDYISEGAASASRESENEGVGQQVGRGPYTRQRKENQRKMSMENDINKEKDPLQEHSYYQSRRESVNIERLRRETFSETDEEIDVVSYEKKTTYLNIAQKQHDARQLALNFTPKQLSTSQLALNFPQKQPDANDLALSFAQKQYNANQLAANKVKTDVRRPRGRPPGPNSVKRKIAAQINSLNKTCDSSLKRTRAHPYQREQKRQNTKNWSRADDDEADKRHLHNDMERQRRISLKNCFDTLKATVPSIAKKEKASKVAILNGAFADIQTLQTTNDSLTKEFAKQRSRNILLKQRLTELRREADKQRRLQQQY
ncbi:uncharacterized protein LOC105258327 isoform X2 [Camponotus floridanus]|uniref:uncharacterized protein LOC105258327 isoform X2 n=1 Tax=Camponotus floridanus TaxID=104421 RepID=UPI00059DD1FA|nr:uncharacterized protein LOC105258327 isoform X2 [Camponotus floridanus]